MIKKTRIMLYVEDVETICTFWQNYFDAKLISTNHLPDNSISVILQLSTELELALFAKSFIAKYSPEVLNSTPSLMLFSANFEQLHTNLPNVGEIVENNATLTFNFSDPEGNYFVVAKA